MLRKNLIVMMFMYRFCHFIFFYLYNFVLQAFVDGFIGINDDNCIGLANMFLSKYPSLFDELYIDYIDRSQHARVPRVHLKGLMPIIHSKIANRLGVTIASTD